MQLSPRKLPRHNGHTATFMAVALLLAATTAAAADQADRPQVKLSRSGICHEKGTDFYEQTHRFEAFDSVQACLAAGGRLPRSGLQTVEAEDRDTVASPVLDQPPAGSYERLRTSPWGIGLVGAGLFLLIAGVGTWWTRRHKRRGFRHQAAAERRRWEEHRLSRADQADEQQLLNACMGDRQQMERLINFELRAEAGISREEAIKRAMDRWRRDIHRGS